ncbi:MAG: hypothetical protein GY708_12755, partial [Actinomycetia bacterium]|nr:hypothetical protein [Actinomycetes bacterium]
FETKRNQLFMLAFGEAEFGKLQADGMIEGAGLDDDDDFYTEGRLAFYLKGRVAGKYLMTAAFDSGREDVGDLFSDIDGEAEERLLTNLDPDRYYPVYGDDSTVHYDVESQGKFYLALDSDSIHLLVGNYPLSLNQTELAAYQRTLYGARFVYRSASKTEFGEPDTQVVLFAADVSYTHVRDELRATGGSLYYLSHRDVVEGSEEVTLVVRDQNTGLVLSRRRQRPNADYTVKYPEGRLMFHRTISSVADGVSLFDRDTLSGNSVFIQVDYETVLDSFEKTASGGRVSRSIGDRALVGGTAISDELAGGTYDLQALDAEVRLGQGSKLKAEFADSEGADSLTYVSDDGGLTYSEVAISGTEQGSAWKLAAELDVGEWFDRPGRYRVNMYYKELEPGFFSSGNFLEQGTEKLGFDGAFDLTGRDTLRVRFDNEDRTDPSGSPAASTESTIGSALWQHQRKRWRLSMEYFTDEVEDGSGNSIRDAQFGSARFHSELTDKLTGYLEHQQTLSGTSNDQSSLGLAYQVLPSLALEL